GTHKFVTEGEHLELTAITKEQSGTYECIASNDISNPDVRTVQILPSYPKPGVRGLQLDKKESCNAKPLLSRGQILSGTKKTAGKLFNGLNGTKIENQGKQSMLVFFNVSEEDYGNYTCVAINTMGITNASIILYGPGAMHDVNGAAVLPRISVCLLLTETLLYLLKF
ncbi:hypothetical protein FQN60_000159, partial [Etheostoma spectabile]